MQTPENVTPNAQVNLGAINEAFEQFKNNSSTWIVSVLLVGFINLVVTGIKTYYVFASTPRIIAGEPFVVPRSQANPLITLLLNLITFAISCLLAAGLIRMAIKQVRGKVISIADIFDFGDVALQVIIASILVTIITVIAFCFCIFPGFVAAGLLLLTIPLVVDQKMGAIEAISTSINTLKSQWGAATTFSITVGVVYAIGILACGIGVFVSAPVAILSVAVLYRNFFIGQSSPPSSGTARFEPAIPPGN